MKKAIHYIDRYMAQGGGMPLFVDDLATDEMILTVESDRIDTRLKKIGLENKLLKKDDFLSIVNFENPQIVILHTLKYVGLDLVAELKSLGHRVILIVHDYYPICEKNVLINNRGQICPGPYEKNCIYCYMDKYKYVIPLTRQIRDVLKPPLSLFMKSIGWYEKRLELHRSILKELDLVVFPTQKAKTIMMRFFDKSVRTAVIPHFQKQVQCRREKGDVCEFAFIGHDSPHKGYELLKAAIKRTKYAQLKVHFFGNFKKQVKSGNAVYEGSFENRNITAAMMKFDALIFPSIWPETSGRVLTEAAACGKYVIASKMTPAEEILRGYPGLITFENNEPAMLIIAMEKLYSSWKKSEFPLPPYSFMSVPEYRKKLFEKTEAENGKD